jgi:hypothetical protein
MRPYNSHAEGPGFESLRPHHSACYSSALPASIPLESGPSWLERNFFRLLLALAAAGLIPRLALGYSQFISLDGWWHLFVATQDRWLMVAAEWKWIAHPPLFYPLLRIAAHLSKSPLMLRSIGIVCGTLSSVVIGLVGAKIYRYKSSALLLAAAYTFAFSIIDLNCDVRAYSLALLFVLLAFNAWLDWNAAPQGALAGRAILRFGLWSSLAILSEYYVIFFLAGCFAILVLRFLLRPVFREACLASLRTHWQACLFAAVFPAALFAAFASLQLSVKASDQRYLQSFLWNDPSVSPDGFLLSNLQNELSFFAPFQLDSGIATTIAFLILLPALIWFGLVRRRHSRPAAADAPFLFVTILLQIALLSLFAIYPFGGEFRHQSILAPFAFITGFLLLDRVADHLPRPGMRHTLFASAGLLVAAGFAFGWAVYPWSSTALDYAEYSQLQSLFPHPATIYVDKSSAIFYFGENHRARWTLQDRFLAREQRITTYKVDDGQNPPTRFLQNKNQPHLELTDPETYQVLAATLLHEGLPSAVIYCVGRSWSADGARTLEARLQSLAPANGLDVGRYQVGTNYVIAELRLRP